MRSPFRRILAVILAFALAMTLMPAQATVAFALMLQEGMEFSTDDEDAIFGENSKDNPEAIGKEEDHLPDPTEDELNHPEVTGGFTSHITPMPFEHQFQEYCTSLRSPLACASHCVS